MVPRRKAMTLDWLSRFRLISDVELYSVFLVRFCSTFPVETPPVFVYHAKGVAAGIRGRAGVGGLRWKKDLTWRCVHYCQ